MNVTLLIVSTRDFEDVALEFVTETVSLDFLAHALVVEDATMLFISVIMSSVYWYQGSLGVHSCMGLVRKMLSLWLSFDMSAS
jgi:hypothetical protein